MLLDKSVDVNEKNDRGETPLHLALHLDPKLVGQVVDLLLSKDADPTIRGFVFSFFSLTLVQTIKTSLRCITL
jgi:ankyrin repeat protein